LMHVHVPPTSWKNCVVSQSVQVNASEHVIQPVKPVHDKHVVPDR
jgi:hypothetical protein